MPLAIPADDRHTGSMQKSKFGGIILCGGQSVRMGQPKWSVELAGRRMLDFALDALAACDPLLISVGHGQAEEPAVPSTVVVRDSTPAGGPLQGMRDAVRTLADNSTSVEVVALLSCDVPLVTGSTSASLVQALADGRNDAAVARTAGHVHPTIAAYRVAPLKELLESPATASGRLDTLVERMRCRLVDVDGEVALNVNTPADAEQAAYLLASRP